MPPQFAATAVIAARLDAGDLNGAVEALNAEVRQHPTDGDCRALLAELLCVGGKLDRADRLLDVLQHQQTELAVGVSLFRQLIRAEEARQQFYHEGRMPELIEPPDDYDRLYLRATVALRDGDTAGASALLAEAEEKRRPAAGRAEGQPFSDFRDLDDVSAGHLDVLTTAGKFYWVPVRRIESVVLHAPERRRDLLWPRATLAIAGRSEGTVFLPAIYPFGTQTPSGSHLLGRETSFVGGDGTPVRGIGLRTFLIGDDARTVLDLRRVEFAVA
jgi:type VI secretion system protein ImpE